MSIFSEAEKALKEHSELSADKQKEENKKNRDNAVQIMLAEYPTYTREYVESIYDKQYPS